MRFNTLDLETTGLNYKEDSILEFSALKFEKGKVVDKISFLVKPETTISPESQKIHKITPEMVLNSPTIEKVLPEITKFCGIDLNVGHNFPLFDRHFIDKVVKKFYISPPQGDIFCTQQLSRKTLPSHFIINRTLLALAEYYKIKKNGTFHRAESDCYYTGMIFLEMTKSLGIKNQKDLEKFIKPYNFVQPELQTSFF